MKKKHFHIPIFVYEDYVDYIQAWYSYTKRFGYTQRRFLQEAGIKAHAFLSDVLSKRKGIGKRHVAGFVCALELEGDAAKYFDLLVQKGVCKNPRETDAILKELADLRNKNLSVLLKNKRLEYFASWRYPLIREYISKKGSISSAREIVKSFVNLKLSLRDVEGALKKLIKWGLIVYDEEKDEYRANESEGVISYDDLPHVVVNDVKRAMIEAAIHAMETMPKEDRHMSMAIRGMSRKTYEKFCKKIDDLRQEFLACEDTDSEDAPDRVVTLTIQAFPVMKMDKNNEEEGSDE